MAVQSAPRMFRKLITALSASKHALVFLLSYSQMKDPELLQFLGPERLFSFPNLTKLLIVRLKTELIRSQRENYALMVVISCIFVLLHELAIIFVEIYATCKSANEV